MGGEPGNGNGRVNILVSDDEPASLLALESVLEGLGENVVTARSGEEVLRHLLRDEFAVVVMDVRMPGVDGFEAARLMRENPRTEHVPIIFITAAYQSDAYMFRGYALRAVDYLIKPVIPEVLRSKVAVFVDLHRKAEEVRRQGDRLRELERQEHERTLAEARMREGVRIAREIQQKLFPESAPDCPGFEIHGASLPAESMGGDYFDYIPMADGALGLVIGDVSGHGVGPALLMAATRAYLRALALTHSDVGHILQLANRALTADTAEERFVTLLLARLDPRTRTLVYSSAGHQPGYVLRSDGQVRATLESTALPLGLAPDSEFRCAAPLVLDPGDLVFLLTDGVVETEDADGVAFGIDRVLDIVRANRTRSAREIVDAVSTAVRRAAPASDRLDDLTAIVLKVNAS